MRQGLGQRRELLRRLGESVHAQVGGRLGRPKPSWFEHGLAGQMGMVTESGSVEALA